jgi:WD40 repeat protein
MRDGFTHLGKSGRRDSLTCVTYLCRDERKITQPVPHSSQQRIAEILKNPVSPELYSVATMRLIYGAFAGVLTLPLALLAQSPGPLPTKLTSVFPKPGFVLHDEKLKLEKPRTVLGPISSDGKGNAVGSFAVYGGSNMIQVTSLSFSGNGKLLAVGSTPGHVDVWDVEKRNLIRSFAGGTYVALSADGRLLAKDGNGIEIVEVASGKSQLRIKWTGGDVRGLSFDPNAKRLLVSANGNDDKVFDLANGQLLADLKNTRPGRFSQDGSLIIGGDYQHLITWSTQDWKVVRSLPNGPDYVTTIAGYPEKNLEVVGGPHSARLLNLNSGKQIAQVGVGYTNFVSFDHAGSLVFTYTSSGLSVWDITGNKFCSQSDMGNGTIALSPDGTWLAAGQVNRATDALVWNVHEILAACSVEGGTGGH